MTLAEQAAKAIKDATGWDAEPSAQGARVQRPGIITVYVWWSRAEKWKCEIGPQGWHGEGPTPEAAIEAVLPRYRAHIASLAADILPGWPRLEWETHQHSVDLWLVLGGLGRVERVVSIGFEPPASQIPESRRWTVPHAPRWKGSPTRGSRTEILAAVVAHVKSLNLPCPLPPFPETPDA